MWKIRNIEIESHVVLAPMAGVTFLSYRNFMKPFGVGLSVTEMVSDHGLVYENGNTMEYIKTSDIDRPVAIQLFGSDPETICKAMDIVLKTNPNFDMFDINLGCPVNKVTKTGAGSALLKDTKYLKDMMSKIVKYSPKPVTAKIRLGWDDNSINVFEVVNILEESGVAAIGIHARTTKQLYGGLPNYELIRDLGSKMKVPLIVSGNIFTLDDAINAINITKATAVMVARGGVGNPYLIAQINHYLKTGERLEDVSLKQNLDYLVKLMDAMIEEKGEYKAIRMLRGIAPKFIIHCDNAKTYRNKLAQNITNRKTVIDIINSIV